MGKPKIEQYQDKINEIKNEIEHLKEVLQQIDTERQEIHQFYEELKDTSEKNGIKTEIKDNQSKIAEYYEKTKNYHKELFLDGLNDRKETVRISIKNQINELKEQLDGFYNEYFDGDDPKKEKIEVFYEEYFEGDEPKKEQLDGFYNEYFDGEEPKKEEIENFYEQVTNYHKELFLDEKDDKNGIIKSIKNQIIEIKEELENFYEEYFEGDEPKKEQLDRFYNEYFDGEEPKKEKIDNFYNECFTDEENYESKLNSLQEASENLFEKLNKARKDILGYDEKIKDSNSTERVKGLIEKFEDFEKQSKDNYKRTKKDIEDLLSITTTGTLSSIAEANHEKYNELAFFWNFIFIFSLAILFFIMKLYPINQEVYLENKGFNFLFLLEILGKIGAIIIASTFSYYANNRASENRRIAVEYLHKFTMNKSFLGHMETLKDLETADGANPAHKEKLTTKLSNQFLEANAVNPVNLISNTHNHLPTKLKDGIIDTIKGLVKGK